MSVYPLEPETRLTVTLGIQSVTMTWAVVSAAFAPADLASITAQIERDGFATAFEGFGFFHPAHKHALKEKAP